MYGKLIDGNNCNYCLYIKNTLLFGYFITLLYYLIHMNMVLTDFVDNLKHVGNIANNTASCIFNNMCRLPIIDNICLDYDSHCG